MVTPQRATSMLPEQKISYKRKNKEWRELCVDYIVGHESFDSLNLGLSNHRDMHINMDLYNSIYDENDLKYVTDPFKQQDGFPASAKDFNIIRPKIDLLLGEESKRPFNFIIACTNDAALSDVMERTMTLLQDYIMQTILANMSEEQATQYQQQLESGEIMPPDKIARYMNKTYKSVAEKTAYHSLNYLRKKLNMDHEFYKSWKDLLIYGMNPIYVGIRNGQPYMRRVNPTSFTYEWSPDLEFIDDAGWALEHMRMTYTEIYDMLYDKMSEKDLNKLLEYVKGIGVGGHSTPMKSALDNWNGMTVRSYNPNFGFLASGDIVDLYRACWRSFRKIGFVTIENEDGEVETIEVDESYVVTGTEISVEWEWVIDIWEGYKVGDFYVGIQPLEYQWISIDNPNSQKIPYTGILLDKSLVLIMKPLQYMYIIVWYRLELLMLRDRGKILTIDVTQIPNSMGIDTVRWLHLLSSLGVNFINPGEERHGQLALFNQFSAQDLSLSQTVSQYIELLQKIEDMISELTGVTRERQGGVSPGQLVGVTEMLTIQSTYITEPLFWSHGQVKKRALQMLLNALKLAWADEGLNQYINYMTDDGERQFMKLNEGFFEDMDVFVSDSTDDMLNLQKIQQLYQPAMQNGLSMLDIVEVLTSTSINQIKEKLADIEAKRQEQLEQMAQQEAQREQELAQINQQVAQQQLEILQQQLELDKYKIDMDNETRIAVAEIGAYRFLEDVDQDNNGIPDPIEIANFHLQRMQVDQLKEDSRALASAKQKEIDVKNKEVQAKRDIENRKVKLEEKKLDAEMLLQKQKDLLLLQREKLKLKTLIRNKVLGESRKK